MIKTIQYKLMEKQMSKVIVKQLDQNPEMSVILIMREKEWQIIKGFSCKL